MYDFDNGEKQKIKRVEREQRAERDIKAFYFKNIFIRYLLFL